MSLRLSTLDADLQLHQRRLTALHQLYTLQTERYRFLQREYRAGRADARAAHRQALRGAGRRTTLDVVLGAQLLQDALDEVQYLKQLSAQDKRIADSVRTSRAHAQAARKRTHSAAEHRAAARRA